MAHNILKVTYEAPAQTHEDGHLTVPLEIVKSLGLAEDQEIRLEIWSQTGFTSGVFKMASGTEVYETSRSNVGLKKAVKSGERLLVTASRP